MTLFTFDEALERPLGERTREARAALEALVQQGKSGVIENITDRVRAGIDTGAPLIVNESELLPRTIGLKHGPFVEYLVERDTRSVQREVHNPRIIATSTHYPREEVQPTQITGFRTSVKGGQRHEIVWTDVFTAWNAYQTLRQSKPKILQKREGMIQIAYEHDIILTIHGLRKNKSSVIDAVLEGVPSEGNVQHNHNSHYKLEVVGKKPVLGVFRVDSGYTQHRGRNWTTYLYREDFQRGTAAITKHTPETSRQPTVEKTALYCGDLLGLYLIQGVAKRQYGVEVNQPLPVGPSLHHMQIARHIGESAILIDARGNRLKPNKTRWNQLYSIAISKR